MACLELQVVIALADDIELGFAGKAEGDWRHDALPGVKLEAGVLPLPPHIHHVVSLRCVAAQVQGHLGLIDAAVLGAELHLHQAPCVLQALHINGQDSSWQNRNSVETANPSRGPAWVFCLPLNSAGFYALAASCAVATVLWHPAECSVIKTA